MYMRTCDVFAGVVLYTVSCMCQADSRVRADAVMAIDGRVGGCTGRSEASGSCECRACVRCHISYLILFFVCRSPLAGVVARGP